MIKSVDSGREPPMRRCRAVSKDPNPSWMGHSIGRWERDTLVVDTVGFNDRSWLGILPHTEMLHVVERYRRPDKGHLGVEVTIEDPGTFAWLAEPKLPREPGWDGACGHHTTAADRGSDPRLRTPSTRLPT